MIGFFAANADTIATLLAIVVGPMLAIVVSKRIDRHGEKRERQYRILSELMVTRRARLDPRHVAALNLVELEFYGRQSVSVAFGHYVTHLNSNWPSGGEELTRHLNTGDDLFADLLSAIAVELGFKFDKRDLERRGYLPTGIGDHHNNTLAISRLVREVLEGKRSLPIKNFVQNDGLFPPSPKKMIEDKTPD